MSDILFQEFPKVVRLSRECIITEKIDGTNAQICIGEDGSFLIGSKTRWITMETDNHGFAKWAMAHKDELMTLGKGRHFGEWWGSGIQRGYGLQKDDKRFSLFNTVRWCLYDQVPQLIPQGDPRVEKYQDVLPECCGLVPVLCKGIFATEVCDWAIELLRTEGSRAVPGYNNPEGIVCWHMAANMGFKKTLNNDGVPKSKVL